MCGIFGVFFHSETAIDNHKLKQSALRLSHRGPDAQGIYSDKHAGLVHTRLSLLDLSERGNQPFWDDSRRYALVYNGEVYNFRELKPDLEKRGVQFKTTSDTEVVLHCIIQYGVEAAVKILEGMFAFAMYDTQRCELVIARDGFGIKPLYVYESDERFLFASEVTAFAPWMTLEPDMLSILAYLQGFGGPSSGASFYKGIKILPPGSIVRISKGTKSTTSFFFKMYELWNPELRERYASMSDDAIIDEVEQKLLNSVKMQLLADAPVGALCSGGLDSSVILAMASKFHSNLAIFHANVVGPGSELEAAKRLAQHLKLDLNVIDVSGADYLDLMPEVTRHYGYPFLNHPNSVPFLSVSKLVRECKVKAVLSGEGADECFIGYPWDIFNYRNFSRRLRKEWPVTVLKEAIQAYRGRPVLPVPPAQAARWIGNRYEVEIEKMETRRYLESVPGSDFTEHDLKAYFRLNYHLRTLLHRNDALGMASSVEARFPFLYSESVKTAINLPYKHKVRFSSSSRTPRHPFMRDKWVLRQVADRYIPPALSGRAKMGFPVSYYEQLTIDNEFFDQSEIRTIFELSGKELDFMLSSADQAFLSRLLFLEIWLRTCLLGEGDDVVRHRLREHVKTSEKSRAN